MTIGWLIAGAAAGWLFNIITQEEPRSRVLLDIVIGIVGAVTTGFLLTALPYGRIDPGDLTAAGFLMSLFGAIACVAFVHEFQPDQV